ncbi:hypothetical protein [Neorhizobium sp. P12A]|nr:hypothetical protein [Neorhizobium sp. P12A]
MPNTKKITLALNLTGHCCRINARHGKLRDFGVSAVQALKKN